MIYLTSGDRLDLMLYRKDRLQFSLSRTADIQGDDNTVMVKQRSVVAADSSLAKIDVMGTTMKFLQDKVLALFQAVTQTIHRLIV